MTWSAALHRLLETDAAVHPAPRLADLLARIDAGDRARVGAALQAVAASAAAATSVTAAVSVGRGGARLQAVEIGAQATAEGVLGWLRAVVPADQIAPQANTYPGAADPRPGEADPGADPGEAYPGAGPGEADPYLAAADPYLAAADPHLSEAVPADTDTRSASLSVLAGGIAHDFNNLLVGIMGNLDLARYSDALPRDTVLHLSAAMQAAERAAELCRQLLAFSGRGPSRFETVDVNTRIRRISHLLIGSLPRHAALVLDLAEEALPVNLDPGQFTQLLVNLLTNAAEATRGESRIRLRTGWRDGVAAPAGEVLIAGAPAAGRFVAITVEDDGEGMDPALLARLCEPFFSTKGTGRGLGLAAVQGIVRNHGGALVLRSTPGTGTAVTVLLPASGIPQAARPRPADARRTARTVLVVDDEAAVRDVLRLQLERLGYGTAAEANGRDGIAHVLARGAAIDAVMLDQTMPIMGGSEAYSRLRQIAPTLPIILMTGFGQDNIAGLIDADPHALFLPKPYALNRLARALRELLGE